MRDIPLNLPPPPTAEQALQDLAYAVSHDLGASARAIRAFSDLLTKRHGDRLEGEATNFLRLINQGAADLQAQIAGLLAYSRVASHGQPPQPIAVETVWRNVVDAASARIQSADAMIESSDLPIVLADPLQLDQLLTELLDNALKFRSETPLVVKFFAERLNTSTSANVGGDWLFRLSDTGRGIPPKYHERVFLMFQRLCPDIPGIGAGLSVVQRIVQRHGGRIWIEPKLDAGTTICFTWPATS